MKNIIILILSSLCFVTCSEDEIGEPALKPGDGEMLLNGEPLELGGLSAVSTCSIDKLDIILVHTDENNTQRMVVRMNNFPAQAGSYTLLRDQSGQNECALNLLHGSISTMYDDVLLEAFGIIDTDTPNKLIITHYDSAAARLEGNFQMTLVVKDLFRIDAEDFPDTLQITSGSFSVPILSED